MKQFHDETSPPSEAHVVIETAWRILGMVKAEVGHRPPELTLTQMRALGFLIGTPGASLSELAEDIGLQMPTTSKVVEELVQQGRVVREVVPGNRRKLTLNITADGRDVVGRAAQPAITRMTELLAQLSSGERATIARAMSLLLPLVVPAAVRRDDLTLTDSLTVRRPARTR